MLKLKKIMVLSVTVIILGSTSLAFAASEFNTPAEVVANLTEKTVEEVVDEKYETGKTYGALAQEANELEAFKSEMLKIKKDILAEKVKSGLITEEESERILSTIEENIATCDGTRSNQSGNGLNAGFGNGMKNQNSIRKGYNSQYN